jgi:tRNA A37 threonylcarbamoyladenosine dehydratase
MKDSAILAAAVLVIGLGASGSWAQEPKAKTQTAIGAVAKISGTLLIVDTGKANLQFTTSSQTVVKVAAGGSKTRAAKSAGEKGVKITDSVHEGDHVSVKYADVGGKLLASAIDVIERRPLAAQPVK